MRINYVIVFVNDMSTSVAFYRDTVGLSLRFESPEWTEFATEGATLALHKARHPGVRGNEPQPESAGRCRPGLEVPDIDVFHQRMLERKVPCLQEPTSVFGTRLAQYADPDGLAISIGETRR